MSLYCGLYHELYREVSSSACSQTIQPSVTAPLTEPDSGGGQVYLSPEEAAQIGRNMSEILDKILVNYSSMQRPLNPDGKPLSTPSPW